MFLGEKKVIRDWRDWFVAAWGYCLDALMGLIESIPVPDFLQNLGAHQMPAQVAWAADVFMLEFGLSVVVAAYTARFILRRIPGIG